MLIGGSTQTLDDKPHLTGRETARVRAVAHLLQLAVQAGIMVEPPLELLPSGLRRNVWAIGLCKLRSAIFLHLELHSECLTGAKLHKFCVTKAIFTARNRT